MYLNYNDMNLTLTRGDTHAFGVEIEGLDNDLTSAYFTCKKNHDDDAYIFQKSLGDGISKVSDTRYRVRIAPVDTAYLEAGNYYYDLVIHVNGDTYTLLKGVLKLEYDITPYDEEIVETPAISDITSVSVIGEMLVITQ